MRFLVDAHLPYALCALLKQRGMDAMHTRELTAQNATSDAAINELSIQEKRIVISKDTDFYYSHLLHGKPFKLVLVRTGNLDRKSLVALFERHLDEVLAFGVWILQGSPIADEVKVQPPRQCTKGAELCQPWATPKGTHQ